MLEETNLASAQDMPLELSMKMRLRSVPWLTLEATSLTNAHCEHLNQHARRAGRPMPDMVDWLT